MKRNLSVVAITLLFSVCTINSVQSQAALRLGPNSQVTNSIIFQNPNATPVSEDVEVRFSASDSVLADGNNVLLPVTPFSGSDFRIDMTSLVFDMGNQGLLNPTDTVDLDFNPRVSCENLDIGAFEHAVLPTQITTQPFLAGRVCEGSAVLLQVQATGEPGSISFQWQRNGENLIGRTAPTLAIPNVSMTDTGYYRVIVFGACCNDTSAVVRLDVDLRPMIITMNDTTIVSGEDVTLYIIESVGTVVWFESDMETVVLNPNITNITESVQFFAVATNGVCADTVIAPVSIFISGLPCRVRTHADTTLCSGDPYRLLIYESTVAARWFITGTTTEIPNGSIVRPTETTTFVLVGFDENGKCATDTLVITVPQIQLDVRADGMFCVGANALLYSTPPADGWFDAENNFLGEGNIRVVPPANATTIYTAQRTDEATGCVVRRNVSITVNPPNLTLPFANFVEFGKYSLTVCEGTEVHLQTNIDPMFIVWERLPDGEHLPKDPTITATASGTFRAYAWDEACGDVHVDLILTVKPMPTFEILPHAPICAGTSVHLTSIPNATIWTDIDGTRVFMPITPQYTQSFIGVFISGYCEVRDTITVEIESPSDFFAGPNNETINQGESIQLWAMPDATAWFIVGTTDTVTNLSVSPMQTTTYVAIWETAICGTLFDTVVIHVDVPETLTLEIESYYGCFGDDGWAMVSVISGGTEPFMFEWSNGATTPLIENLTPGRYIVTVTDFFGTTGTDSVTIASVTELHVTFTTHTATNQECNNGSVRTTVTGGTPPYYFEWRKFFEADTNIIYSFGQHLMNDTAGIYTLRVTDSRGCDKDLQIILRCEFERVMPSILVTPNNDGLNDFLYIQDIEFYPINTVTIINSYGEEIIRIQNYDNRDRVWNGRNRRGQPLPDGTYYYIVVAEGVPPMAGWLLLRMSERR